MERRPRNYFQQDVPHLRANTYSATEHHLQKLVSAGRATSPSKRFLRDGASPRNYFLQDVPRLRANTFSGTERQPRNYFLQDVPHDGASSPTLLSDASATSLRKHFLRDGASLRNYFLQDVPPLRANTFSGTESQPRNYFLQAVPHDGASSPTLLSDASATSLRKHFLRDGASPRNYFLQDVPPLRANTFSRTERQPRNYFLQDVPTTIGTRRLDHNLCRCPFIDKAQPR